MRRLPTDSGEPSRPALASPFSELREVPEIIVAKTERIATTPFDRSRTADTAAEAAPDPASDERRVPVSGLAWSSPESCTTAPDSDVVSAPRPRARFKRR